jgi:hypothetical protein
MKRLSLIIILVLVISALSFSSVLAQRPSEPGYQAATAATTTNTMGVCGWGDKEGQTIHGKLYAPPGFNLKEFLRYHPEFTMEGLNKLNKTVEVGTIPGTGLANGSLVGCNVIVLPSA